jgi:hypothetical protein
LIALSSGASTTTAIIAKRLLGFNGLASGVATDSGVLTVRRSIIVISAGVAVDLGRPTARRRLAGIAAGSGSTFGIVHAQAPPTNISWDGKTFHTVGYTAVFWGVGKFQTTPGAGIIWNSTSRRFELVN